MKAILMSIQPKWCEKIVNGEKTIEVRKTRPNLETPCKVYIYCTKGKEVLVADKVVSWTKEVIGEFVCDRIDEIDGYPDCDIRVQPEELVEKACLTQEQAFKYIRYGTGYAWHISELKIYDKPKELGEFKKVRIVRGYHKKDEKQTSGINIDKLMHGERLEVKYITRAPQSWCYVEELEG